jgi:hypothetical protein
MLGADSLAMTARMLVRSGRVLGTGRRTEDAGRKAVERVKYFPLIRGAERLEAAAASR